MQVRLRNALRWQTKRMCTKGGFILWHCVSSEDLSNIGSGGKKTMGCFWWGGVLDRCEEGVSKGALQSGIDNVEFIVCAKEGWAGSTATFYFDFYASYIFWRKRGEERPEDSNGKDEQGRMHTEGDPGTLFWLMTNFEKWQINDPSRWNIDVTRDCSCTCGCSAAWPVKFWQECHKN